jgi:glycosyltransferase involved in cell wall biosynthesis
MRILTIGESVRNPSGFGQQMRMVVEGAKARGHEVFSLCPPHENQTIPPVGDHEEWIYPRTLLRVEASRMSRRLRPDVVFIFVDATTIGTTWRMDNVWANIPVYVWLPFEGDNVPEYITKLFKGFPEDHAIFLDEHGRNTWDPHVKSRHVIPHGTDIHRVPRNSKSRCRKVLRTQGIHLCDSDTVLLCTERNDIRKHWDAVFSIMRELQREDRRYVLLAHTVPKYGDMRDNTAYDLPKMLEQYGIQNNVFFTGFSFANGFSKQAMVDLYSASDLRISCSSAEGFGIGAIEAGVLGIPQVVNQYSSFQFPGKSIVRCLPAEDYLYKDIWRNRPNAKEMALTIASREWELAEDESHTFMDLYDSEVVLDKLFEVFESGIASYQKKSRFFNKPSYEANLCQLVADLVNTDKCTIFSTNYETATKFQECGMDVSLCMRRCPGVHPRFGENDRQFDERLGLFALGDLLVVDAPGCYSLAKGLQEKPNEYNGFLATFKFIAFDLVPSDDWSDEYYLTTDIINKVVERLGMKSLSSMEALREKWNLPTTVDVYQNSGDKVVDSNISMAVLNDAGFSCT